MDHPLLERWASSQPKRILTIDGGGIRGLISVQYLRRIEQLVCDRQGCNTLSDYFDLIGGTSTGSIIASLLAHGKSVDEVDHAYQSFAKSVFKARWFGSLTGGVFSSRFSKKYFQQACRNIVGEITIGDPRIRTGLMIVARRVDSGSPWVVHNNPDSKYYDCKDGEFFPNKDFRLAQVVMASCSAPTYFIPEEIEIGKLPDGRREVGTFVDGGCSPHNNPAFVALRVASLEGYGYGWPMGEDNLEIVSVGTGRFTRTFDTARFKPAAFFGIQTLNGLRDDCSTEVEIAMQWLSDSPLAREIDSEMGSLANDTPYERPLFKYFRYNVELSSDSIKNLLGEDLNKRSIARLQKLDRVGLIPLYERIGQASAENQVSADHFATGGS